MIPDEATATCQSILIIVPVYRDLQVTRDCLEALIASNLPEHASIAVINDSSPEEELGNYCRELAAQVGFKLIVNDSNLGFVRTVNRGFALDIEADIVLLNSDTVVSNGWLQRLQSCAYSDARIGTVTPFSNNGTICSYPVFAVSNPLPAGWTAAELDKAFQAANAGIHHEIPTAVGFCMYIKRTCLNETGPFDEASFGHGYGEECDFSLRASALGWKHAAAADVFVYHKGEASFGAEANDRKRDADKIIDKLHPGYHRMISDFLQADPLYTVRKQVDAIRLGDNGKDIVAVLDEHERYSRSLLARSAVNNAEKLAEQEKRRLLEQMLGECRAQFADTDRALAEAQTIANELDQVVNNLSRVVNDLHAELYDAKINALQLAEQIEMMQKSRSWRYTAWLRRR